MERLLTAKQASEAVGVPLGSLYRLVRANMIPSYRAGVRGRGVRFRASEVLTALRREPTKPTIGDGEAA
jgi:excisionase family DNA binding protein